MSLVRAPLPTTLRRIAYGLAAAAAAGTAVHGPMVALLRLIAPGAEFPADAPHLLESIGDTLAMTALIAFPLWLLGGATAGLATVLLLRRWRLCGPAALACAATLVCFTPIAAALVASSALFGDVTPDMVISGLAPPLFAGPAAGFALRRVARDPRAVEADRLGALEETFR